LLSQGRIVGSYAGSFDSRAPLPWSRLLLWAVPGLLVSLAAYALLRRQELRQRQQLGKVAAAMPTESVSGIADPGELTEQLVLSGTALRRRLEQLETVRKTMVADIAHELRTPLTVMRARLDRALQQQDALEPAELATLQDEVYRMSKLLHDLQQLALAESGHLKLDKQWFPVSDLLEEMTELMRLEAESSGIEVASRIEAP
ncbi:histidine kinase dimerization/phospho-acceptor domain-containing protein, partial [Paenibacillus sp. 598K]|uniref:histidine kinase dimerization/phospho-acceptor domain-containing protein n=1 Tax=Paenibacillus sp. 598K TaxID=1117987 RepID=UPI0011CFB2EB